MHRDWKSCGHPASIRLTCPAGLWMNRTIKDATVRAYHYESHDQLRDLICPLSAFARSLLRLMAEAGASR